MILLENLPMKRMNSDIDSIEKKGNMKGSRNKLKAKIRKGCKIVKYGKKTKFRTERDKLKNTF